MIIIEYIVNIRFESDIPNSIWPNIFLNLWSRKKVNTIKKDINKEGIP